jgi:hypothetical protein
MKKILIVSTHPACISATDFNASTPQELFDKAKSMTHSLGMQQMYRKRVPTPRQEIVVEKIDDTPSSSRTPPVVTQQKKKYRVEREEPLGEGERILTIKL